MCRSIKKLRLPDQPATDEEIRAAALQFVRKVSGYRIPSHANQAAFDHAVIEIAASTKMLLNSITGERAKNAEIPKTFSPRSPRSQR